MKALIVVNLAGFLTFLWSDIEILKEMGYRVDIAMNSKMADGTDAIEVEMLKDMKINYFHIDFDTKNPINKSNIKAYHQIKKILASEKYDLIHCHTPIAGLLARFAGRKTRKNGTKIIYTTHGFTFTDKSSRKSWLIYYNIEKFASRFCDAIITINHEDFNNAKKMLCSKVFLLPGVGIDVSRFENVKIDRDEYREQFGVTKSDILVLAVGELSERKNQKIIIQAINLLKNKEKYVYLICGRAVVNSSIKEELMKLANELGVRIVLAGHRLDIPAINKCADIAVIPSIREGLGLSGLEALASGIPVIGSDVQGIREYIVNGKTGFLCDPYSPEQFARSIEEIQLLMKEKREEIIVNCREMACKFDKSKSIKKMRDIYQEIM